MHDLPFAQSGAQLLFHLISASTSRPRSSHHEPCLRRFEPLRISRKLWQTFFFLSILFHHSNIRLPEAWERRLARILTTPRMHGIHHSAVEDETSSNWSSGFAFWDHLHGTFRLDIAQSEIDIGVPAYRDPGETALAPSLELPFRPQRDDWHGACTRPGIAGG